MKTKTMPKAKTPVHLRTKPLRNGNQSLYLDIYLEGQRTKEYLQMYLVPECTPIDKVNNANTLRAAQAICAQRLLDITNGKADIKNNKKANNCLLSDWLKQYAQEKGEMGNDETKRLIPIIDNIIKEYKGPKVTMANVTKNFVLGFIRFLSTEYKNKYKENKPLAKSTQHLYCVILGGALNMAVRKGIIKENPFELLDKSERTKAQPSQRVYLSIDEVKTLIATPCSNQQVKMAFIFSAFCGLRISDIRALTWGNITFEDGQAKSNIIVKKTKSSLSVPLSAEALRWLPDRGETKDEDTIFTLPVAKSVENILKRWGEAAEIKKHITFHTARHTFATMMLTLGADLYTTSKLLGHANVSTTQIYAKIVDKKKVEAVNLVDGIFNK